MYETAISDTENHQPSLGVNYMDWPESAYMKQRQPAYYSKNNDNYSDLLEDQEIYMFDD